MRRRVCLSLLSLLIVFSFCAGAFAAPGAERPIATIGNEKVSEGDLLFLISGSVGDTGDGMRTAMALVQMDEKAQLEALEQLTNDLLLALAAREKGLDRDADVARMLRWQEIRTLAGLYLTEVGAGWDMSDVAVKKYYEDHPDEFMEAEAVKIRYHTLSADYDVSTLQKGVATTSVDLASFLAQHGLQVETLQLEESAWMEKGLVRGEFSEAFFSSDALGILPPISSEGIVYLVEITARRAPRLLSWDEARLEASQRLQRYRMTEEISQLKNRYDLSVDKKILFDLGK